MTKVADYRRDIDGLRAIAVLSVFFYHLGVSPFSGGFVGVDVFFVISGFLITRLIVDQKTSGKFTFAEFYIRRVRRLFPALAFTIAATLAAGVYYFSTVDLARIGGSAIAAILSLSNIYFWQQAGYFDAASVVKPLLHTWSLSVEEQFYLVWPALLVILLGRFSRQVTLIAITLIGLASLVACQLMIDSVEAVFYLSPFRAVEFAIGAALVWVVERPVKSVLSREVALATGLALIAYAVVAFDEATPFPGLNAMVPCVGAALAIYGGEAPMLGRLLSNAVAVRIGLISYSLYLAHWPIIVFYQYQKGVDPLSPTDQALIAVMTLIVSELMYRYVETPFRAFRSTTGKTRLSKPAFGLVCAGMAIALISTSAHIWASGGWAWRLTPESRAIAAAVAYPPGRRTGAGEGANYRILAIGDSHATQHLDMLSDYFAAHGASLDYYRACLPFPGAIVVKDGKPDKACGREARGILEKARGFDAVIVAARWDTYTETTHNPGEARLANRRFFLWRKPDDGEPQSPEHSKAVFSQALSDFVVEMEKTRTPILFLGQVPPMGADFSRCATQPIWRAPEKCRPYYTRDEAIARVAYSDDALRSAAQKSPLVRHISFIDKLCPENERYCRYMSGGEYLYRDDDHVNFLGARMLGIEIRPSLDDFYALIANPDGHYSTAADIN